MRHYRIELRTPQAVAIAQRIKGTAELPAGRTDDVLFVAVPSLADDRVELGPVVVQHIPTLPHELPVRPWPILITDAYMIGLLARVAENWRGPESAQQLYAVLRSAGFRPSVAKGQAQLAAEIARCEVEITDDEPEARDALIVPEAFLLEGFPDPDLIEMNAQWAYVIDEGEMMRTYDGKVGMMTVSAFKTALASEYKEGKKYDGRQKKWVPAVFPKSEWWLTNKRRRTYDRREFLPGRVPPPGIYNTWPGFAVTAQPGDCSKFWALCRDIICDGNLTHLRYLKGWMANAVQNPGEPGQVAIVLHGGQGTGKGTFAKYFGRLFGPCYMPIGNANRITGQFTGHLHDKIAVFVDEAVFADDRRARSILKFLVTEESIDGRGMYVEAQTVQNCLHLILGSNEDHVLDVSADDRRYFVLRVSDAQAKKSEYFRAITAELNSGGAEALLHELMTMDLSDFDVRKRPETRALAAQKDYSLSPEEQWLRDLLRSGSLPFTTWHGYPTRSHREKLLVNLRESAGNMLAKKTDAALCRFLERWGCSEKKQKGADRYIEFPDLGEMREAWAEKHPAPDDWDVNAAWGDGEEDDGGPY